MNICVAFFQIDIFKVRGWPTLESVWILLKSTSSRFLWKQSWQKFLSEQLIPKQPVAGIKQGRNLKNFWSPTHHNLQLVSTLLPRVVYLRTGWEARSQQPSQNLLKGKYSERKEVLGLIEFNNLSRSLEGKYSKRTRASLVDWFKNLRCGYL